MEGQQHKSAGEIRFLQLNMNRAGMAHDLLEKYVRENKIDIVIGQEPNQRVATKFICDKNCDCFIYLVNKITIIKRYIGNGFVSIETDDFLIISSYFSPNRDNSEFESMLNALEMHIRATEKEVVIGADLNAKTPVIGSVSRNKRGEILQEWLAANNLIVSNKGNTPTFVGARGTSIIDFTATTEKASKKICNWRINEKSEFFTDHQPIEFSIDSDQHNSSENIRRNNGWIITQDSLKRFEENCVGMFTNLEISPEIIIERIKLFCRKYFRTRYAFNGAKAPVYWWNDAINECRKKCHVHRRILTRSRKKMDPLERQERLKEDLQAAKKELKNEILKSKKSAWKQLCEQLEEDIWGKAYQIVAKKMKTQNSYNLSKEDTLQQIEKLFPTTKPERPPEIPAVNTEVATIEEDEVTEAAKQLKIKKAPGPDNIPPEVVRACALKNPRTFRDLFNLCLTNGIFPQIWKKAKLVLIGKPTKEPNAPIGYRPICLIDAAAKLLETVIKNKLEKELESKELISQNQFGFRKGKSTLDAIAMARAARDQSKSKAYQHRDLCAMLLIDVRNAFNSVPVNHVILALLKGGISPYLVKIIQSYLTGREILTAHGDIQQVTCGVPQGSILGPVLWNVFYDRILRTKVEPGVELVAYADDLAVIVKDKAESYLREKLTHVAAVIGKRLEEMGLEMAKEKTELVILAGDRKMKKIEIDVDELTIISGSVKYLGVIIDNNMTMKEHVIQTAQKLHERINSLSRIMATVNGPRASKKRLIANAVQSVMLYAAPIWKEAVEHRKYAKMLEGVNRRLAIMIAAGYRTVPTEAIQVIAGLPPLELLAEERSEIYKLGKEAKKPARRKLLDAWQQRWDKYDGWCKIFIKDIKQWQERKWGEVDHYLTQAFTGHGVFGVYLKRIGKSQADDCWFCGAVDNAEHTIFECNEFSDIRKEASTICGIDITKQNISGLMLVSEEMWKSATSMLKTIMKKKVEVERKREK